MVKIHFNYCQWSLKLAFRYELKENEIDDKRARWVNEKEIKGIEVNGQKQMKMRNTSILFDS